MTETSPIRPTDAEALELAATLMQTAQTAALATRHADSGDPHVTRIAVALIPAGLVTLVSDLSLHTRSLRQTAACSLLLGEPGDRGDPLTHPRLTITTRAAFVDRDTASHHEMRADYLIVRPKAKLYVDFKDFNFVRFDVISADLNGGFGKAFHLTRADIALALQAAGQP